MARLASCMRVAAVISLLVSYAITMVFTGVLSRPLEGRFNSTIRETSEKYRAGLTPSPGTFSIWYVIYVWQGLAAVYTQSTLFRKSTGKFLFMDPRFISPAFCLMYGFSMIQRTLWRVVYTYYEELVGSTILIALGAGTAAVSLVISCMDLNKAASSMVKKKLTVDIWLTRIIVQNSIAIYGGWMSVATTLNIISAIVSYNDISSESCCFIALAIINVILVVWFVLETFIFDQHLRYVFAHYGAFVAGLAGSFARNYKPELPYMQYELALLVVASVFAAVKLVVMIMKTVIRPINYKPDEYETTEKQ